MSFAGRVFTLAGIYGLVAVAPMYALEGMVAREAGPLNHPESYYGFIGVTLAFQVVFLIIGRDPARFRPMMLAGVLEKLGFGVAVWALFLQGRAQGPVLAFASVDLLLAALFVLAYWRTPRPGDAAG